MKALVIGATGATGKDLVNMLLKDPDYTEVVVFVRRTMLVTHPKLTQVITDFDNLDTVSGSITGDVLFCCLGTTLKAAGTKEKQWHVDYQIPAKFAEIAKENGISKVVLLSAYGASVKSRFFYSRVKGSLEDKIKSLAFEAYIIFRPGLLLRRDTDRPGEVISAGIIHLLNKLGLIKRFRPMPTNLLAEKMASKGKLSNKGVYIVLLDDISRL